MADKLISKNLLLAALNIELEKLERTYGIDITEKVAQRNKRSLKYRLAWREYIGIYNIRTLVQSLAGE